MPSIERDQTSLMKALPLVGVCVNRIGKLRPIPWPVGSEEARSIALALASVRRSNWACSFPAPSFHEDVVL